jgi:hypothetical protein
VYGPPRPPYPQAGRPMAPGPVPQRPMPARPLPPPAQATDSDDSSRGALIGVLIFVIALVIVGVIILIALAVQGPRSSSGSGDDGRHIAAPGRSVQVEEVMT